MTTIPLIGDVTDAALLETRHELDDRTRRLAPVFVPVGPDPDVEADLRPPLRILFVGQIAYQRGGSATLDDAGESLDEGAVDRRPAAGVGPTPPEAGALREAAGRHPAATQAAACVAALRAEIVRARPTVTVLMTGGTWGKEEILFPAFGGESDWGQTSPCWDKVAVLEHREFGPLLWINHPTTLRLDKSGRGVEGEVLGFVAGYAAAAAKRHRTAV